MLFNSLIFLFAFLPLVLGFYFLLRKEYRNIFLLIASLAFYAWGEAELVVVMIISICLNYAFGILISSQVVHKIGLGKKWRWIFLALGVAINLSVLVYYKYFTFILNNLRSLNFEFSFSDDNILLPIGISFFTFQSISYLIDVYRRTVPAQKNLLDLGLYISLFPQLIAGPIVRYEDIYKEIRSRTVTREGFSSGILKFIRGLAKKVIIANNVGLIADKAFDIPVGELGMFTSWVAIICYALQIYFDFSGYSDMAIGLGRMFGFNIKENFMHPYTASSVKEFWRRWHISLSTWFRDYLYIPLGGSRGSKLRTYINLVIVFFITGLWHGASWNFVIWGLFHGSFLLIERSFKIKLPSYLRFLNHIYLLLVVLIGWVLFRSDTLTYAIDFIGHLFDFSIGIDNYPLVYLNYYTLFIIFLGILFSAPIRNRLKNNIFKMNFLNSIRLTYSIHLCLFVYTIFELVQSNYNPFIYFRF